MYLIRSQHACLVVVRSQAPHEQAAVFPVIEFRIHLLIFVSDLIDGRITFFHHLMNEFHRFPVGRIRPVEIVAAEHIDKLRYFIEYISLLPGTAVAVSTVSGSRLQILHEIFLRIHGSDPCLIQNLLVHPEGQITRITGYPDDLSVFVGDHIRHIPLREFTPDILCHHRIIEPFQPSRILERSAHLIIDLQDIHTRISRGKNGRDLLLSCIRISGGCDHIDL